MSDKGGLGQAGGVGFGVLRRRWLDGREDSPAVAGPAAPVGLASGAPMALASAAAPGSGGGSGGGTGGGGGTLPGLTFLNIVTATQSQVEGASGLASYFYVVSRSGVTGGTTTVNWAVSGSGDRAANAGDFAGGVLPSGSLSFAPGVLTQVITVQATGGFSFGNQAFSFIGTTGFGGVAGQLRWQSAGAYRLIQGDVNGDSVADLTIRVKGTDTPVSSWFVL